ncbi:MAG: AGE family epimerase/isomerase [Armatimonadota bacterium]|nr:AGE family epimerase/isomerase [Armatimonadota bacterium]
MPNNKYLNAVREFLSTLIEKGTDHYGKKDTPLFCLALDPDTYSPPKPPAKVDRAYAINFEYLNRDFGYYWQSHLHGSNLIYDQGTIRALYGLTDVTGEAKFKEAADKYLGFFFENMISEQTGIFGWGEHIFWNVYLDYIIGGCFRTAGWHNFYYGHELERWTTIYDVMWEKNPEKTQTEIEAIYDYKIHDYDTFICNRHSDYYSGKSDDLFTFIKHTGLFAHAFAFLHSKTGDPKHFEWARKMGEVFWNIRDPKTNLIRGCVQRDGKNDDLVAGGSGIAEISLFLMRGYQWSPEPGLLEKAHAYLTAFKKYCCADDEGNFRARVGTDGTDLKPGEFEEYWEGPIRIAKSAALAYSLTRDPAMLDLADLIITNLTPEMTFDSTIERCQVSDAIEARSTGLSAAIDLYELTGEAKYLAKARALADDAISRFMYNGLLVSTMKVYPEGDTSVRARVYDARSGAGWLALNLIRLQRDLDATEAGTFQKFDQLERIYD